MFQMCSFELILELDVINYVNVDIVFRSIWSSLHSYYYHMK